METEFFDILITEKPLEILPAKLQPDAGAIVEFFGVVRKLENGTEIAGIEYEANLEMTAHQFRRLAQEASEKFAFAELVLHHRVGFVPVSEPSLFVRVTAGHRGPAFAACQWIIDSLKEIAPIWKHPISDRVSTSP